MLVPWNKGSQESPSQPNWVLSIWQTCNFQIWWKVFITFLTMHAQLWLFYVHLNIFKSWYKATVFSSPELKAQVSFSDHLSSVVCPSVCLCKFSHFHLLLQNHWANFNQTWHKVSEGEGDSRLFKWRPRPSKRGDNWELIKINWQLLKIFSRTTGPIFNQNLHKPSLGKGDSSLFKWRTLLFFKGR